MRCLLALLLFSLAGCHESPQARDIHLYTEAEQATVSGGVWPIAVTIDDSRNNLAELRPLPKTAYLWNGSTVYRLVLSGVWYSLAGQEYVATNEEREPYKPADGKVTRISFNFIPEGLTPAQFPDRAPGVYNLSIQLNGSAGIHTVCGSFRFTREYRMIHVRSEDLH
jgi:hypothetical protein